MDRSEHLQWCKDRTIPYLAAGDLKNAFSSFMNDMSKHKELENHLALRIGMSYLITNDVTEMNNWIQGFN